MATRTARRSSGQETEQSLLLAARAVFAEKNYLEVTVDDIIARANVSRGTFYVYFKNKDDIFARVIRQVVEQMVVLSSAQPTGTRRERIEAAHRVYLEAFIQHRHILRHLFEAAPFNPGIAALHNQLRQTFAERIRLHLRRMLEAGKAHPVDANVASYFLVAAMERFAYLWLATEQIPDEGAFDLDTVVETLTDLWYRAIYRQEGGAEGTGTP